jgi:hypothetical protein
VGIVGMSGDETVRDPAAQCRFMDSEPRGRLGLRQHSPVALRHPLISDVA